MSGSKDDEYFSDGITEDIITQLSKISELRIISRTSVMKYKKSNKTIPEIANELGAGSILEGSVRRYGDKVRITGQLINAHADEHIWAETFDRKVGDIFEVQSEIAKHIAKELEAQLAPKEEILLDIQPTNNIEAYAFCLKGREFATKYTDEDNENAIEFYKKALEIDSNYALAYASLASSYDQKVRRYYYPENWRDSAVAMSNKALELNPNLAEAHSSLAKSYESMEHYKLAKYHYEKAIRLNPNYYAAIYNLGVVYFSEGKLDKAYKLIKDSILLQPDNVFGYIVLGGIFQKINCDSLAISRFNKALQLDPKNLLAHIYIIDQYILQENLKEAQIYSDSLMNIAPNWAFALSMAAKLEMIKKNFKAAKNYLDKSISLSGSDKEYDYGYILLTLNKVKEGTAILNSELQVYLNEVESNPNGSSANEMSLADIYSTLGNKQRSIYHLKKASDKGWIDYRHILVYPYLDSLKNTIKFKNLINVMKSKTDSIKALAIIEDPTWSGCK